MQGSYQFVGKRVLEQVPITSVRRMAFGKNNTAHFYLLLDEKLASVSIFLFQMNLYNKWAWNLNLTLNLQSSVLILFWDCFRRFRGRQKTREKWFVVSCTFSSLLSSSELSISMWNDLSVSKLQGCVSLAINHCIPKQRQETRGEVDLCCRCCEGTLGNLWKKFLFSLWLWGQHHHDYFFLLLLFVMAVLYQVASLSG